MARWSFIPYYKCQQGQYEPAFQIEADTSSFLELLPEVKLRYIVESYERVTQDDYAICLIHPVSGVRLKFFVEICPFID